MADLLKDFAPEDKFMNLMDCGNISGDDDEEESDYEARLYSLVHYSEDQTESTGDYVLTTQSRRSKALRLDAVRNIIDAADNPSQARINNHNREPDYSNNNARELLRSYKKAYSEFSNSTPAKKNTLFKNSVSRKPKEYILVRDLQNADIGNSYLKTGNDDLTEPRVQNKSADFRVNENPATLPYAKNNSVKNSRVKESKSLDSQLCKSSVNNGKFKDWSELHNNSEGFSDSEKNQLSASDASVNCKEQTSNNEINSKASILKDEDKDSKYRVSSKKDMEDSSTNITEDKMLVTDMGSDGESISSIVVIGSPVKGSPPILILSSDDEGLAKSMSDEDIVVLYDGAADKKIESMEDLLVNLPKENLPNEDLPMKKKNKKKKKKKLKRKSGLASDSVSPSSWTESMSQFYNESWGGENFDVGRVQRSMCGTHSKWSVLYCDVVPNSRKNERRIKCLNCNTYGHGARYCPQPHKQQVCLFCGIIGHSRLVCPSAICLCCGSAMTYNRGCTCSPSQISSLHCSNCNLTGHVSEECPEHWRQYHSVITEDDLFKPTETYYKPRDQHFCCNCAGKGHLFHECNQSKRQGNWRKRARSPEVRQAKRRKLDKNFKNRRKREKRKRLCRNLITSFPPIPNHITPDFTCDDFNLQCFEPLYTVFT